MEDIEKGVDTTELWVERLRIAAVEHYSRHQVPQDLLIQKKTAEYVKQAMTSPNHNDEIRIPKIVDPVVRKIKIRNFLREKCTATARSLAVLLLKNCKNHLILAY